MTDEKSINALLETFKEYVRLQVEIARLEAVRSLSRYVAGFVSALILSGLALLTFLLFTITAGFWLGEVFGSNTLGFLAVSGFYLLVFVIMLAFREPLIRRPLRNRLIAGLLQRNEKET